MCYYDFTKFSAMTEADAAELGRICGPRDQELRDTGKKLLDASLALPRDSK